MKRENSQTNFYIRRFKPNYPVAVFNSEQEGLDWLESFN